MGIALTDDHRELSRGGAVVPRPRRRRGRRPVSCSDAPEEARPPFWADLAELGWLGLHIDEEYGGSGFGLPELVVVIDELGRAIAPGPFVPTVVASAVLGALRHRRAEGATAARADRRIGHRGQSASAATSRCPAGPPAVTPVWCSAPGWPICWCSPPARTCCWSSATRDGVSVDVPGQPRSDPPVRAGGRSTMSRSPSPTSWPARAADRAGLGPRRCSRPRRSAGPPTVWTPRSNTPRCASSSAAPSPPSRPSSTTAPT